MAKNTGKYFLALVPEGDLQREATALKRQLFEKFNLKYALRSPAHVTLKMPFLWNEAKEADLVDRLKKHLKISNSLTLEFYGFDRFGKRVLFIAVKENPLLISLQTELSRFCRKDLKLVEELSDRAYHPHMTIAFKDTKPNRFLDYWSYLKSLEFHAWYQFDDLALLKKIDNRWEVVYRIGIGGE